MGHFISPTASALEARANVEVRKAVMRAKSGDLTRKSKILTFLSDVYLKKEEVAVFVIVLGSVSGAQHFSVVRLATFHHRSKKLLIRSFSITFGLRATQICTNHTICIKLNAMSILPIPKEVKDSHNATAIVKLPCLQTVTK